MRKFKLCWIVCGILSALLLYIFTSLWLSTNHLSIHSYNFPTAKTDQQVTLAVISDLHGHEFGCDNEELAERIKGQSPDLILMDGDFLNADSDNADIPCDLIRRLIKRRLSIMHWETMNFLISRMVIRSWWMNCRNPELWFWIRSMWIWKCGERPSDWAACMIMRSVLMEATVQLQHRKM